MRNEECVNHERLLPTSYFLIPTSWYFSLVINISARYSYFCEAVAAR
jgi:hypothetical protein